MQITRQTEYAVHILIELALAPPGQVLKSSDISMQRGIPDKFLKKTLQILTRSGLVTSKRGVAGGVRLAVSPHKITMADVLEIIEGPIAINPCLSNPLYCDEAPYCRVRAVLASAQVKLVTELRKQTLADLAGLQKSEDAV